MVTFSGIGGTPDPLVPRGMGSRDPKYAKQVDLIKDGIEFSAEAQEAAETARISKLAQIKSEIRDARVEEAKQKIREGTYKVADVVNDVAARLTKFL